MVSECVGNCPHLKPVELAVIKPDFKWQKQAWFGGKFHSIVRLTEQTEWVKKELNDKGSRIMPPRPGFIYQITPFVFQDEADNLAQGAHFVVPEGMFTNTVLFTGEEYRWRCRIVSGAGWLLAKDPSGQILREWLGVKTGEGKVFEFSKGWISRCVSAAGYGPMIIEGIDIPKYKEEWEQSISKGDHLEFWQG